MKKESLKAPTVGFLAFLMLAVIALASSAHAASQVVKVSDDETHFIVYDDEDNEWAVGQELCVIRDEREIACGSASKRVDGGVMVEVISAPEKILEGDEVRLKEPPKVEEKPEASEETETDSEKEDSFAQPRTTEDLERIELLKYHRNLIRNHRTVEKEEVQGKQGVLSHEYNLSAGLQLHSSGGSLLNPTVQFQNVLSRETAFGLSFSRVSYNVLSIDNTALNLMLTFEYFPMKTLSGFFARGAAGLSFNSYGAAAATGFGGGCTGNNCTVSPPKTGSTSFTLSGVLGWRFMFGQSLNLALSAGAQYYTLPAAAAQQATGSTSATGAQIVLPTGLVEFGFAF